MTVREFQGSPSRTGLQSFVVPAQVTSITVELWGAGAAHVYRSSNVIFGGYRKLTLAVTPGETLYLGLGTAPILNGNGKSTRPGLNGGGPGGGQYPLGGAGGTDLRQGGAALANRVVVAGGAGAPYSISDFRGAGAGGADTGGDGLRSDLTANPGAGKGGTQTAGGASNTAAGDAAGTAGSLGQGGSGGGSSNPPATQGQVSAGGGGSGYYGGGGANLSVTSAAPGYAGGGGSNFPAASAGGTSSRGVAPPYYGQDYDSDGTVDPPHGFARLTYNAPPNQPTATPMDNGDDTAGVAVSWQYSDPENDAQSQADVRWRVGSGAWTTTSPAVTGAASTYTFPASTFAAYIGQTIEWQVLTYDASGLTSPWSASAYFTPRTELTATPTVTIPSGTLNSQTPTLTITSTDVWSYYRLVVTGSDGSSLDSGWLPAQQAGTQATMPYFRQSGNPFVNGVSYTFKARVSAVNNATAPSPQGSSSAYVATVAAPSTPVIVSAVPVPASAAITLTLSNPNASSDATPPVGNDIYRTDLTNMLPEVRVATGVPVNGMWTDWQPALNVNYQYRMVAVAANGNSTSSA